MSGILDGNRVCDEGKTISTEMKNSSVQLSEQGFSNNFTLLASEPTTAEKVEMEMLCN